MYSSNEKIGKILNIKSEDVDTEYALGEWFATILNKTIEELDIADISRMLRQDILIEVAVNKSVEFLKEDPVAGDMYDGQLLEVLYSVDANKYKEHIHKVKDILIKINSDISTISTFEWICDEDFREYLEVLEKFLKKIS